MSLLSRCLFAIVLTGAVLSHAYAQTSANDVLILKALEAANKGDRRTLDRLASTLLAGHELAPYLKYWRIQQRIGEIDPSEMRADLQAWSGTYLGNRLRGDWLRWLGVRRLWDEFDQEYALLVTPELEIQCLALQSQLNKDDPFVRKKALDEAHELWKTVASVPQTCVPLFSALVTNKRVDVDGVWQRVRLQVEANRPNEARTTLQYLPDSAAPNEKLVTLALDKAPVFLNKHVGNVKKQRSHRELAVLAIGRVARSDPEHAARDLMRLNESLAIGDRGWLWGQLGWQGALRQLPQTMVWYQRSDNKLLSNEVLEWKVRSALRAGNWDEVMKTIEVMPATLTDKPEWIYWLGRAYAANGDPVRAKELYARLSGRTNFYGNLADDELGQPIQVPLAAKPPTAEELQRAQSNPSLRRALALLRLGLRLEGIREWNWGVRDLNDRDLLAAAVFANRNHIYDRAISAADRTRDEHDYSLRYLAPFRDKVSRAAKEQALDEAWVYGLIRQESRFITDARSSANASGLMQLMPKTARWVAKKTGIQNYNAKQINDPDLNLTLGTSYLQMVYENLDYHPVLASAAYNAGPGRAQKWRNHAPIEGAIYAETIPFDETRDYVKKVMSNTVYYAALFEGRPQSLKTRLGTIAPRDQNGTAAKIAELP